MRLIDADALLEDARCDNALVAYLGGIETIQNIINDQPTIEAEPVKHGRWMWDADMQGWYCPHCPSTLWKSPDVPEAFRRCPNCGAKMRSDEVS